MPSLSIWAPFCAMNLPYGQYYPRDQNNHMAAPIKVARQQTTPELSGTWPLPPEPTPTLPPEPTPTCRNSPEPSGTFQDLPEPTFRNLSEPSGTYYLGNLRQHTPEPSEIFRNFPGTCLRNSYHFTPELTGTFRDLPPEPTPAYAGTLRNLPETAFGTYTSTRQNSPEPSGTFLRNLLLRPAPAHTGTYLGWRPH